MRNARDVTKDKNEVTVDADCHKWAFVRNYQCFTACSHKDSTTGTLSKDINMAFVVDLLRSIIHNSVDTKQPYTQSQRSTADINTHERMRLYSASVRALAKTKVIDTFFLAQARWSELWLKL